jgi:hypothetical protein
MEIAYYAARRLGLPMPATFNEFLDKLDDIDVVDEGGSDDELNPTGASSDGVSPPSP